MTYMRLKLSTAALQILEIVLLFPAQTQGTTGAEILKILGAYIRSPKINQKPL